MMCRSRFPSSFSAAATRRQTAAIVAVMLALAASARGAMIWTIEGKSYDGDVRFTSAAQGGGFQIATRSGETVFIAPDHLLYASIGSAAAPVKALDQLGPLIVRNIGNKDDPDAVTAKNFYALRGKSGNVTGTADACYFFARSIYGDCDVTARLLDVGPGSTLAGLMMRDNNQRDADMVCLLVNARGEAYFRFRRDSGQWTTETAAGKVKLPAYLRLSRSDMQFTAYQSDDGKLWSRLARVYEPDDLPANKVDPNVARASSTTRPGAKPPDAPPPPGIDMSVTAFAGLALAGSSTDKSGDPVSAMFDSLSFSASTSYLRTSPGPAHYQPLVAAAGSRGIVLRTGTFFASPMVLLANNDRITFMRPGDPSAPQDDDASRRARTMSVDVQQIARFVSADLSTASAAHIPAKASGVLLRSDDFMEGDITSFRMDALAEKARDANQVEISNVTLGLAQYAIGAVQAVVFRDVDIHPSTGFSVRLTDGTVLVARSFAARDNGDLAIDDYAMGSIVVPAKDLLSIQGAPGKVLVLVNQPAAGVEGPDGAEVLALTARSPGSSFWLSIGGMRADQGIVAPPDTSLRFKIPDGSRQLITRVGVPERLPEKVSLRFLVLADGKEIYKSPLLTSRDKPVPVNLPIDGTKELTLRVESAEKSDLPAFGLWDNPLLVK